MAPGPLLCGFPKHGSPNHGGATTPSDWSQMAGEAIGSSCIARPAAPSCPVELPPQCPSDTCGGATGTRSSSKEAQERMLVTEDGNLNYMSYDVSNHKHQVEKAQTPIPLQQMGGHLRALQDLARTPRLIGRFHATRNMQGDTLPFMLEVSTRGAAAQKAYDLFDTLCHQGAWHLVGGSLRHERIQRTPLAQAVAQAIR